MTRTLTLTIETDLERNTFDVGVLEGESGYTMQYVNFPFEPHEHPGFNAEIGNQIYSWVIDAFEYDEAEIEEREEE